MNRNLLFYLAFLFLSSNGRAALVATISSTGARTVVSTNFDLKSAGRNYNVDLKDIAAGKFLSAARANSNAFSGDAFDSELPKALQFSEQLPKVKQHDYEPRLLDIPGVYFVGVWLHGQTDDILIPLSPTFERWKAHHPYAESELMKLLQPEAKKVLKSPASFGGGVKPENLSYDESKGIDELKERLWQAIRTNSPEKFVDCFYIEKRFDTSEVREANRKQMEALLRDDTFDIELREIPPQELAEIMRIQNAEPASALRYSLVPRMMLWIRQRSERGTTGRGFLIGERDGKWHIVTLAGHTT